MSPARGDVALDITGFGSWLAALPRAADETKHAVLVRLHAGEEEAFGRLCGAHALRRVDPIERQLADLAAVRLPSAGTAARQEFIAARVEEAGGLSCIGSWAYYPWDACIVHVLAADDYFDVVTDRNHDKITVAEQTALRQCRVGVMGLSVGGEAAVAIAQEHLCGELVIADFDRLDLSNVNRLTAGCDELGLRKTTIIARRIAKIDPYLRVTAYDEGVTHDNVRSFLEGLDLLVEECDSLPLKLEVRRIAREQRLNIVFAGDERGFLSVEPYALDDTLPPFHGRVAEPPRPRDAYASPVAFMRALTEWLGGWDAISARSRSSLEQIGVARCGYPQLAGEARFAAGQVAHVARRLLLGERLGAFIGHIDLAELLPPGADAA